MLYLQRATHITIIAALCSLLFNTQALAIPLQIRQDNGPRTLTTTDTQMTPAGPMTETCTVVLTPITDNNGNPAVEEVRVCTLRLEPTIASAASSASSTSAASTTTQSSSSTSSSISPSASNSLPSSTISAASSVSSVASVPVASVSNGASVSTTSSGSVSSATVTTSVSSVSRPVSPNGISSVTVSVSSTTSPASSSITNPASSSTTSSTVSTTSVNTNNPGPGTTQGVTAPNDTRPTTSNVPSATSTDVNGSAAAAETSDAGFSMPGKKLSVLPIGLGVFAGISVIALIVVGLVTYERTKYRKAFRQQKLAESGASMGYGGMAR